MKRRIRKNIKIKNLKIYINIFILEIEFIFKLMCNFKLNIVNKLEGWFYINNKILLNYSFNIIINIKYLLIQE